MARRKLTKPVVDALKPQAAQFDVWDSELPGFAVRVNPSGSITAFCRYRLKGHQRRYKLGRIGQHFTITAARKKARGVLGAVERGEDPQAERQAERKAKTVADLWAKYEDEHLPSKKPSSQRMDRANWRLHLSKAFGKLRVAEVTRHDVSKFKESMADTPGACNRCMALLSKMMRLAEDFDHPWRQPNTNPCRSVKRYPEDKDKNDRVRDAKRFLTTAQRRTLDKTLSTGNYDPAYVAAIRVLALTGARLGEIANATWDELDSERGALLLPDSKTGSKVIELSEQALAIIESRREPTGGVGLIFQGRRNGKPYFGIEHTWKRVRADAGLKGKRLHDLRHSFVADALAAGVPLSIVGAMLGHKSPQTTERYKGLEDSVLKQAAAQAAARIAGA